MKLLSFVIASLVVAGCSSSPTGPGTSSPGLSCVIDGREFHSSAVVVSATPTTLNIRATGIIENDTVQVWVSGTEMAMQSCLYRRRDTLSTQFSSPSWSYSASNGNYSGTFSVESYRYGTSRKITGGVFTVHP